MAITNQSEPSGQRRPPLNRQRVLQAAIALADEGGVESVTMRKLAKQLGVEAMSLYNHVANKDDILDGIVDIVFGEIELPSTAVDWKTAMRRRALSTREALSRHRWAIVLMESRTRPGPANFLLHESVLACLREAGFSLAMTVHAYSALDSYIYGFALQEKSLPPETPEHSAETAAMMLQQIPADRYPHTAEVVGEYIATSGYRYADEFEFGLDLILDSLERSRATV